MSSLFDKTLSGLGAAVNMRQVRSNIISSNIANAETPGYKAKKVDFEGALARALDIDGKSRMHADHGDHFPIGGSALGDVRPNIYDNPDIPIGNDGNTVDLEKEMAELQANSLLYRAAVQLINKKLSQLKYAVTEGGR